MVIYNEEKVLERALESFYEVVDEIIIVHDGECTDNSLAIAKKYTDKVFELEHVGEAEKHRPFTYEKAQNDWILQVDADEYLSEELKNNLEKLIADEANVYEAAYSVYQNYYLFHKRMIFRKSAVFFIGVPHDAVTPLNDKIKITRIKFKIMHEPLYNNLSLYPIQKKWKSWPKIHARSLLTDFCDIPKWNCPLTEWETRRKLLIKHPFFLGMIGATIYRGMSYLGLFLQYRKVFIIRMGILSCLYSFYLYYYIWDFKKRTVREIS